MNGTTRFCSISCRCKHNGRLCNKNGLLTGHKQYNTGRTQWHAKPEGWTCKYCQLKFRTRYLLNEHKKQEHTVHVPWNKGLTKETSEQVKLNAIAVSNAMKNSEKVKLHATAMWTEERRKAQSELKKKLYSEHPEKHPNFKLAHNRGKMTYPEQLVYDWLNSHNIKNEHNYHFVTTQFNRYVDFYLPDMNIFIEVDGGYWHQDDEKDKLKDDDALLHGIATFRIKPKNNVIEQLETMIQV